VKTIILTAAVLILLGAETIAAEESRSTSSEAAGTAVRSKGEQPEPAECPIKKMIDGKLYCFQNDPALTKPQGGEAGHS